MLKTNSIIVYFVDLFPQKKYQHEKAIFSNKIDNIYSKILFQVEIPFFL